MYDAAHRVRHDGLRTQRWTENLMTRLLIRIGIALLGAATGLIVAAVVLDDMTLDGVAFVLALVIFVASTAVLEPFIEKIGNEHLALVATLSSLITTLLALLIIDLVSDGLNITGALTWVLAAVIVWAATALATAILVRLLVKDVGNGR
jgi:hypothetical protein